MSKKFKVLRIVRYEEKSKNGFVFRDLSGKIYFLDRRENKSLMKNIELSDVLLVWVVKELDTIGFVRISIGGKFIDDFINSIPDLKIKDYLCMLDYLDENTYLSNYFINSDSEFDLEVNSKDTLLEESRKTIEFFKLNGYDSEDEIEVMNTAILNSYIYNTYKPVVDSIDKMM